MCAYVMSTSNLCRSPVPGDVIIFHPVEGVGSRSLFNDDVFIKRVVAIEGDTVEVSKEDKDCHWMLHAGGLIHIWYIVSQAIG